MASIEENTNEAEAEQALPPQSPPADQCGDRVDRISCLCDDVLVLIPELAVMDARELVRTGVLSRRWRGLWTLVPSLHLNSPWLDQLYSTAGDVVGRYVAFVNNVLAQRARSEASLDLLQASLQFNVYYYPWGQSQLQAQQLAAPAVEAAEAWIRYAMQHHARLFFFSLRLPEARKDHSDSYFDFLWESRGKTDDDEEEGDEQEETDEDQSDGDYDEEEDKPVIDLQELPSSTKLETMCLCLMHARVRLPSTVVFASLKNLRLEFVDLAPGSGHLLAHLLSSACCPSLQWLDIRHVCFRRAGTWELVLDAGELLQLSMDGMDGMRSLELRTPNLLRLEIKECDKLRSLTVSAPALEELALQRNCRPVAIHGDFPCVLRWH